MGEAERDGEVDPAADSLLAALPTELSHGLFVGRPSSRLSRIRFCSGQAIRATDAIGSTRACSRQLYSSRGVESASSRYSGLAPSSESYP